MDKNESLENILGNDDETQATMKEELDEKKIEIEILKFELEKTKLEKEEPEKKKIGKRQFENDSNADELAAATKKRRVQ